MFEVFNYMTGETVGYVSNEYAACLTINFSNQPLDYINADEECSCTLSNPHCK